MNTRTHYDNHANDIEYFNIHKHKIEVKRKPSTDLNDLSDAQLTEKLDDIEFRIEELTELYNSTKHEGTHESLAKTCTFRSVIRKHIRLRKLETNQSLRERIKDLEKDRLNVTQTIDTNNSSEIEKLRSNNKSLIGEVNVWRKKYSKSVKDENKELVKELTEIRAVLSKNREVEKTKRHELNLKSDKPVVAYLLSFIRNTVSKDEYAEVVSDIKEIREKETPH